MRMLTRRAIVVAVLSVCPIAISVISFAQSQAQSPYRLAVLRFNGLNLFTSEQVSSAIGLRVGDRVSVSRLAAAADVLAKSGAFDDVNYRYSTDGTDMTAEFRLVETKKMLPCFFDNFVWFSDQQIGQALRHDVPFYAGVAPESGATVQQITSRLRDLIRAKGIAADVEELPDAILGKAVVGFRFRVTGISMPIRSTDFPGASAVSESDLASASKEIVGRDFSSSMVSSFVSAGLIPLYRRRGYLRARFDQPRVTVSESSAAYSHPDISVSIPVEEGKEFLWNNARWNGNHQFSLEELDRILGMKSGEVANQEKVDNGLTAIGKAYEKHGYIDATLDKRVALDDATRMASWEIMIDEGTQYRIGQVHFSGIPEAATKELIDGWGLKPGEIYDGSYLAEFIQEVAVFKLLKKGMTIKESSISLQRDKPKAIVDVYIAFR
jgi:outer membrane protein assembly factor BamA